jgi:hypothetical protein
MAPFGPVVAVMVRISRHTSVIGISAAASPKGAMPSASQIVRNTV